jgi:cardiolipin synthase C
MKLNHYLCLSIMLVLTACSSLEIDTKRNVSYAYDEGFQTMLGKLFASEVNKQKSESSGFLVLDSGREAFLKRLAIIRAAEKAIDLQYYIWNSDQSGRILAQQLLIAADKGVYVRLLLDDFNIGDRDNVFAVMDAHPNIELRLYNPNSSRKGFAKISGLFGDFGRLNQRMHNKSIVVDGSVAIVGGRNIGDEYFDLHEEMNFRDRDVLAIGKTVADVSESFDAYWNNDRAFSVSQFTDKQPNSSDVKVFREELNGKTVNEIKTVRKLYQLNSLFEEQLDKWLEQFVWADAELIFDKPPSFNDEESDQIKTVALKLAELTQGVNKELIIESAYLIPGDGGIELMVNLAKKGVDVSALTNSLASNDLTTNHSGYARRRKEIIENSVDLYELRPDAESCLNIIESTQQCDKDTLFGLHAKSMVFDREIVFVGSFNVNQRSIYLNTETALIIYSPELAGIVARDIEENFSGKNSWKVELDKDGDVEWLEKNDGKIIRYSHEPETGFWRRFSSRFFAIFPAEKYL